MFKPVQVGDRKRYSYARINDVWPMPHLIDIQNKSYEWFIKKGLDEIFHDISPITDFTGNLELSFESFSLDKPKRSVVECKERSETYAAPMSANVRLLYKDTGEIKESTVFMGDFPLMTETGTFVINGAERVIVSQLVRSPGFYVTAETDPTGKKLYSTQLMPNRGAWIEFETDATDAIYARVDRTRKLPATTLLKALGLDTEEKIIALFGEHPAIMATLEKDTTHTQDEALIEVYKKLRPGEPPIIENARTSMEQTFFDPKRYDLANVGRFKLNKKLGWRERLENAILAQDIIDESTGELIAKTGDKITLDVLDKIAEAGIYAEQGDDDYSEGGLYTVEVMHRDQPMRIVFTSGIGGRHHNVRVNDVLEIGRAHV